MAAQQKRHLCRSQRTGVVGVCLRSLQIAVSEPHFEPVFTGDRELTGAHLAHLRPWGALLAPGAQLGQRQLISFRLNLHAAVPQIADPARDSQVQGAAAAGGTKAHSLNAALNDQAPAFDERLDPPGLRTGDEASVIRFGAAASAARHREQIVEELAQWR